MVCPCPPPSNSFATVNLIAYAAEDANCRTTPLALPCQPPFMAAATKLPPDTRVNAGMRSQSSRHLHCSKHLLPLASTPRSADARNVKRTLKPCRAVLRAAPMEYKDELPRLRSRAARMAIANTGPE